MKNIFFKPFLATLFVFVAIFNARADLPKSVQIDRLTKIISESHQINRCDKVISHFNKLINLTETFPNAFYFFQGKCLYQKRQYSKSMLQLEHYFNNKKNDNTYYDQALNIYTRAEEKLAIIQARAGNKKSTPRASKSVYSDKLEKIKIQSGMDFIAVVPGCFQMGSPLKELERADDEIQHKVCITKPYLLGKLEVTQGQWESVMGSNPAHFKKCSSRCPIENVDWDTIQLYIKKLNEKTGLKFRLPTEAEWEYAARAGTTTPFSFGENINTSQVNYDGDHPYIGKNIGRDRKQPVTVGSLPPNPWGFHEMHGNVWEFVQDWHDIDYYKNSPTNNPKGPKDGSFRVRRGGSWRFDARFCRSAYRGRYRANSISHILGFRLALDF